MANKAQSESRYMKEYDNWEEYMENKNVRDRATFCYRGEKSFFIVNENQIPENDFNKMFPLILTKRIPKGKTVDGTFVN